VHHYENGGNFCISIPDKKTKDTIFFIKSSKELTFDQAIAEAVKAEKKGGPLMPTRDTYEMPVIDIGCQRDYKEMLGLAFTNKPLKEYILTTMMEALKLKVNESGAKVESMAVMVAERCAAFEEPKKVPPRQELLAGDEGGRQTPLPLRLRHRTHRGLIVSNL
jgi:hypothetical protein